ncbi:MAG TPA: phosphotransferase family protein [Solirubrobacteraceae bacterium]|nr:phosphotransferase family protein [Solirubrobacteraceae bacterium]
MGDGDDVGRGLRAFLARELQAEDLTITGLRRHIEGFSWETWDLTADWSSNGHRQRRRLIARRVPQAGLAPPYDVPGGWELARVLRSAPGIPLPEPLWIDAAGDATGRPLFFMEHVDGDVPAPWNSHKYFRDAAHRATVGRDLVRILAAIHAVPLSSLPAELRGFDDPSPIAEVAHFERVYEQSRDAPEPVLERAFGWLAANAAAVSGRRTLVHGDFRIGNAILRNDDVVAMLDWELAHVGDPVEDLANFAHRLYRGKLGIPSGLLSVDELLAAYAEEAGWEVSPQALKFWLVFNDVRSAVMFHVAARLFADGATRDLRYAAFSRQQPYLLRHVMADLHVDG